MNKMKRNINNILFVIFAGFSLLVVGCSLGNGFIPDLFVETSAKLEYNETDNYYILTLAAGDEYEVNSNLGEYDGDDYYIDYVLEEEKQFATIENNKISISEDAINGDQVVLFVQMKNGDGKVCDKEKIIINISNQEV